MRSTEEFIIDVVNNLDDRGYLKARESTSLEFKENFVFGNIAKYFKTIASFANTKGGILLFGIKDSPRTPIGVNRTKFDEIQQEKISTNLIEYFSPQIMWDLGIVSSGDNHFGYIKILESDNKPVICKKTSGKILKNGEIYYRYRGQSKVIEFSELKSIQDEIRKKERLLWMKHIERISKIGPQNVAFIDLFEGALESGASNRQLVIEPKLMEDLKKQVKFIEEGHFVESDGAPALKLVGEIVENNTVLVPELDPNKDYPYLTKHLAEELHITSYQAQTLIWKLQLKGNKKFHIEFDTSKTTKTSKYSKYALRILEQEIENQSNLKEYFQKVSKEYTQRNNV